MIAIHLPNADETHDPRSAVFGVTQAKTGAYFTLV